MTTNADKDVEQQECTFTAGRQNSTAALEGSLVLSYKTKHTLYHIIQQSH